MRKSTQLIYCVHMSVDHPVLARRFTAVVLALIRWKLAAVPSMYCQ
jgi:hypothetical protein